MGQQAVIEEVVVRFGLNPELKQWEELQEAGVPLVEYVGYEDNGPGKSQEPAWRADETQREGLSVEGFSQLLSERFNLALKGIWAVRIRLASGKEIALLYCSFAKDCCCGNPDAIELLWPFFQKNYREMKYSVRKGKRGGAVVLRIGLFKPTHPQHVRLPARLDFDKHGRPFVAKACSM